MWFTPDRKRFFLVPHDLTLPPGDLEVRSLSAVRTSLAPESLSAYEVGIDAARAHVDQGFEGVASSVRDLWESISSAFGGKEPEPSEPASPRLDWLGATPGEMATDPEKAKIARKTFVARAAKLVGADLDEEKLSRYESALDRLGTAVVRDAERLRSGTAEIAEDIAEGIDDLEARRPEIEARLEAQLEATGEALVGFGRDALSRLQLLARPRSAQSPASEEQKPEQDTPEEAVDLGAPKEPKR